MALVLYNGGATGSSTGTVGYGRQDFSDIPPDQQNIQSTLESLQSKERKKKYIGLANQGNTCYMNSLLQSLYMCPEFRQFIYSFSYNSDLHGNKDYCIPYQLQRLFANLQLSRNNFVSTTSLTKSFGWAGQQSYEQHDTQEFCRVLFDAIEQSFAIVGQECETINQLYQGETQSYTRCRECGYESARPEKFLDLQLPIKNEFGTGVSNSSVEMAIENYIKPELLDGSNQYFCETCNKKVDADRGIKFTKLPLLFDISLSRFTLNWETYQRVKIYDSVTFPFYLNMNDYMKGYEGIENKVYQKEVDRMKQFAKAQTEKNQVEEKFRRDKLAGKDQPQTAPVSTADVEVTHTNDSNERDLMSQEDKSVSNSHQAQLDTDGDVKMQDNTQQPKEEVQTKQKDQDEEQINTQTTKKERAVKINVQMNDEYKPVINDDDYEEDNPYLYATQGPKKLIDYSRPGGDNDEFDAYDVAAFEQEQDGSYKVQHKNEKFALFPKNNTIKQQNEEVVTQTDEEKELALALEQIKNLEEKEMLNIDHERELLDFLKQGDFVYELYAVLVHSGSAMGGHYYCYIKSNTDKKWYNFNDTSVSEISEDEVFKTFGDRNGGSYSGGTAYMLKYRQYNPTDIDNPLVIPDEVIPSYLKAEVDEETDKLIKDQLEIEEKVMSLKLRIHHNNEMKTLTFRKNDIMRDTCQKIMEEFGIQGVEMKNFRLRAYDPKIQAKLAVYDHYDWQLHKLQLVNFMDLTIETKTDEETFEEYDPNVLYLRVIKYVEDQKLDFSKLDSLPTQVIAVNKENETVIDLEARLSVLFDIPQDKLAIFLRHEHIYNNTVRCELYNIDWRKTMKIKDAARLDHGAILYVEEGDIKKQKLEEFNWHSEFVKDQEKLKLMFHDPINDPNADVFSLQVEMKTSNTLLDLKQRIGELLNMNPSDFVLKRYRQQREFKNFNSTLVELGLTNGALIKVEKGTPHQDGVYEINIQQVELKDDSGEDDVIFTKKPLFKLTIEPSITALELRQRVLIKYNEMHPDHQLTLEQIRMRNPKIDDLGDVILDDQQMENLYLFDDKEIYMQEVIPERNFSCFNESMPNNVYHVIVREWNPTTWQLGPIYEIKIDKSIHASKFSEFLATNVFPHIPSETLFCSKVSSLRQFRRSDLAIKRWNRLKHQQVWLGQSTLEINRDAVYVIVKDNENKLREQLTDEEIQKYASNSYIDHLAKKYSAEGIKSVSDLQQKDALYNASLQAKPDYSKVKRKAETGVKITVGGPQPQAQQNGVKINPQAEKDEKKKTQNGDDKDPREMETDEDLADGVFIEALF